MNEQSKPVTRAEHFERLNDRQKYPIRFDEEWEIREDEYLFFLGCLPPLKYHIPGTRGSFAMREFYSGSITNAYYKTADNRYFCRWIDYRQPPQPPTGEANEAPAA